VPASSQALSLAQYAIMSNNPLVSAISFSLIDNGSVLADIPFVTKKQLVAHGVRWTGALPTVNWRAINGGTTVTTGTPSPFQEQAYIMSNAIDTDKVLVEDESQITDPRKAMLAAYLKSVTYDFNNKFINNDPVTGDANAIVGLAYRIANGATYGVRPENSINAGNLDLSQATATQATANKFLEFLDQLLWSVASPDGTGIALYVNDIMKRRLAFVARLLGTSGGFSIAKDQFGRQVNMYNNAVIRDIGYQADQATRIIPSVETTAGAPTGGNCTSIYAAHYGEEYLVGWQMNPLNGQDLGLLGNDGTIYRTLVDWTCGLFPVHTRAIARMFGLKLA
jgi:hypothetical protein